MQSLVSKTKGKKAKFLIKLSIIELANVPLVDGAAYVKWGISQVINGPHEGRTSKIVIRDHKAIWNHEENLTILFNIDRHSNLTKNWLTLKVFYEYDGTLPPNSLLDPVFTSSSHKALPTQILLRPSASNHAPTVSASLTSNSLNDLNHNERLTLGEVKINLAEYVDACETSFNIPSSDRIKDTTGICRRYLLQDSKINSTMKVAIYLRQIDGDRNFVAPPLKSAPPFVNIAGIPFGEQNVPQDCKILTKLSVPFNKSHEKDKLDDLYRRMLLAQFTSGQSDELHIDQLIENIFVEKDPFNQSTNDTFISYLNAPTSRTLCSNSSGNLSPSHLGTASVGVFKFNRPRTSSDSRMDSRIRSYEKFSVAPRRESDYSFSLHPSTAAMNDINTAILTTTGHHYRHLPEKFSYAGSSTHHDAGNIVNLSMPVQINRSNATSNRRKSSPASPNCARSRAVIFDGIDESDVRDNLQNWSFPNSIS